MRIVIDMQGAQTESRFRGIGRYSLSLALALVRQSGDHEILLALNGLFDQTIEPIRSAFNGLLPQSSILVWDAPGPTRETNPDNQLRRSVAERLREAFLQSLQPDVVLVTSLFEGFGDDAITSVGQFDKQTPTAVILYDLIPLINPDEHFLTSKLQQDYYQRKIASLKQSQLLLAISDSARQEALTALKFEASAVTNVSGAFDESFKQTLVSPEQKSGVLGKLGITRSFVFYTGGADERKNLPRLIEAYAGLSPSLRSGYQLVLAGKMPAGHIDAFLKTADHYGLAKDELIVAGFVADDDLLKLYNLCSLFVFPSLHEGFGIPPLEAMSCGAPVIGSHATSLPEVIGLPEALFDPTSVGSIRTKIEQALTDDEFRSRLIQHGLAHARTFTWADSAKRALAALARFAPNPNGVDEREITFERTSLYQPDRKKILLLKLDHLGDFILAIPAITRLRARYPYAEIDILVGSWSVPLARSLNLFNKIHAFDYFKKKSSESASASGRLLDELVAQLGQEYDFAIDLRRQRDTRFILTRMPATFKVGYESFDPKTDIQLDVALPAHPDSVFEVTTLNQTPITVQMTSLVDALPASPNDYVSFPGLIPHSMPRGMQIAVFPKAGNDVKEWPRDNYVALIERLASRPDLDAINVYFANQQEADDYQLGEHHKVNVRCALDLPSLMTSLSENVLCIANNSFGAHIGGYLGLMVIGIYGGHETVTEWAPVFKNAYVIHHPVACSPCHIAHRSECPYSLKCLTEIKLDTVYNKVDEALQAILAKQTTSTESTAEVYLNEQAATQTLVTDLTHAIAELGLRALRATDKLAIATAIATNHPKERHRQLFVDISELAQHDARSGIQRVVRSVLKILLDLPPPGYIVIPVYATMEELGYRKAAKFTEAFIGGSKADEQVDEKIIYRAGDCFLGIDLHPHIVCAQRETIRHMRERGVNVQFVVFDLLCATMPQHFVVGSKEPFVNWLKLVTQTDGAICISKAVADEFTEWVESEGIVPTRNFSIKHFNLGSDIQGSVPSGGVSAEDQTLLDQLHGETNFLMVGTLEPRKGHAMALSALEQLWQTGQDVNLIVVGKQGWLVDALIKKIDEHPLRNKRLFWLKGISDEMLEKIYAVSTCLIVPSEGEGFGLPLIEAAHHHLPIIARDLPVFKEVAGDHAFYFSGDQAKLAQAIETWLRLYKERTHPVSAGMPILTWQQSTQSLLNAFLS